MKGKRSLLGVVARHIVLIALSLLMLVPIFYMVSRSLMPAEDLDSLYARFLPSAPTLDSYAAVFDAELIRSLVVTLIVVGVNVVGVPLSASFVAYGFTKCRFAGRDLWFSVLLATMMLPGIVIQIPIYVIYSKMGWINTPLPLTVPNILGGGVINIFLVRQYMKQISNEIEDAAQIDGANKYLSYLFITLPLCVPVLTLLAVNTFIAGWNDFSGPLIYVLGEPKYYTLSLYLYIKYSTPSSVNNENLQMASGVLMTILPALLFVLFQKQLIEGVSVSSGIKG